MTKYPQLKGDLDNYEVALLVLGNQRRNGRMVIIIGQFPKQICGTGSRPVSEQRYITKIQLITKSLSWWAEVINPSPHLSVQIRFYFYCTKSWRQQFMETVGWCSKSKPKIELSLCHSSKHMSHLEVCTVLALS